MSSSYLNRVSAALNTPAASNICLEHFRLVNKLDKQTTATDHAPSAFRRLRELLMEEHGIRVQKVTNNEIKSFFEEARFKEVNKMNAKEYQDVLERIIKYAALRARRSPRRRFAMGVMFSTAAAVGITAATAAASTGMMVAAAPAGAALGAFAIGFSSLGSGRRDRARAAQHNVAAGDSTDVKAAAAEPAGDACADASAAEAASEHALPGTEVSVASETEGTADNDAVEAVAEETTGLVFLPVDSHTTTAGSAAAAEVVADEPSALPSQPTPQSDELVSAVIEVLPVEETTAAAAPTAPKATPFAAVVPPADGINSEQADVALASAYDTSLPTAAEAEPPLPDLLRSISPEPAELAAAASAQAPLHSAAFLDVTHSADLPPLAMKKKSSASKKLKKSLSKSYKSLKKAMSISDTDDKPDRASKDVLVTPSAGKSPGSFSLRRSFSRDSAREINGDFSVQGSEGSATLKKMKDLLRRSFSNSTPRASIDGSNTGNRSGAA